MILIKILILFLLILLLLDLVIYLMPKSKLRLSPLKYKIYKTTNEDEIFCEFKITNYSKNKETMIPNFYLDLDFFEKNVLKTKAYKKEIFLEIDNKSYELNNYSGGNYVN